MDGIGLSLPNRGILFGAMSPQDMYALAQAADDSGFVSSIWVGDGLIAKPRVEAIVSLAGLAARTVRVRLGVCCMATFPLRNPVMFAVQWASLDVMSGGRTQLAVCLGAPTERAGGDFRAELEAMGIGRGERVARFEEGIRLVKALWSGPAQAEGRFWNFPEVDLVPKPLQKPCPIWIASNPDPQKLSEQGYARAVLRVASLADGWQTTVATPERFGYTWQRIKDTAERADRDSGDMTSSIHLMINVGEDREHCRAEAKRFLDAYYSMDVPPDTMDAWGAYGPPNLVADRIAEYVTQGLDLPILRFASYDPLGQFRIASESLLPSLVR